MADPKKTTAPPAEAKPKRKVNAELQALARIDRILAELTEEQADRVTTFLRSKYFPANYTRPAPVGVPEPTKPEAAA